MGDILVNGSQFLIGNKPIQLYAALDNGHQYVTSVRHDLSIVEVANEDVQQLLNKRCGCCDSYYSCFRLASQTEVDLWRSPVE